MFKWRLEGSGTYDPPVSILTVQSEQGRERVPVEARQTEYGYLFTLSAASDSPDLDWVRSVLAAGKARLQIGNEEIELIAPRILNDREARQICRMGCLVFPGQAYLLMGLATGESPATCATSSRARAPRR
jgi:hypothetical protein